MPAVYDEQFDFSGGIQVSHKPVAQPENSSLMLRNVQIIGDGYFSWRKGRVKEKLDQYYQDNKPQSIRGIYFYKYGTTKKLLVFVNTKVYLYDYINKNESVLIDTLTNTGSRTFNCTDYYDNVVITDGENAPVKFDGTVISPIGGTSNILQFTEEYQNYLFGSIGDRFVYFSDLYNIDAWNDSIVISKSKFDPVKALKKFQGALWIWTEREIYIVEGESRSAFVKYLHSSVCGTVAHATVKVVCDKLIWLDNEGFWSSDGGQPTRIGFGIAQLQIKIDKDAISKSWAVVYTEPESGYTKYLCFVPVAKSGESTINNYCFVYHWDFDCWTFNDNYPGAVAAEAEDTYGNKVLFSGDENGWLWQLDTGEMDDGNIVPGAYISRTFDCKKPEFIKTVNWIWLWYRTKVAKNLKMQISVDFGNTVFPASGYKSLSLTGSGDVPDIYELEALGDEQHYLRDQRARVLKIGPLSGVIGHKFQLRLWNVDFGNRVDILGWQAFGELGGMFN